MKKIILSLLIALTSLAVNAQGQGPRQWNPEDMAKRQVERIKETCGISDEQYTAIYNLYLAQSKKQKAEMDSIMAAGGMNQGQGPRFDREAMQKRREAMNAEVKKILTAEQYAKYEEMQQQMRNRGPRRQ